ncbi:hypothetical protein [Dyadobacter sp. 32]|uniref:hypothetical protein n=1 Tax=Dyadobacter sp. 32 TaxID=538966 RepID=UPI0011EFFD57
MITRGLFDMYCGWLDEADNSALKELMSWHPSTSLRVTIGFAQDPFDSAQGDNRLRSGFLRLRSG